MRNVNERAAKFVGRQMLGFILTMRNVNPANLTTYKSPLPSFILTMRNVNLAAFKSVISAFMVLY